jgi:radical SAM protein with 4Fe4S-binding SPASM domain
MKTIDSINRNDHLHVNDVPCAALFYSFAIDCTGNIYPCNSFFFKVGNMYLDTLSYIWGNSEQLKQIKSIRNSDSKYCNMYEYKPQCDRCPALVYMENKDLYSCDRFAKKLANIRMQID